MYHTVVNCAAPESTPDVAWCSSIDRPNVPVENVCYESCREARCGGTGLPLAPETFRECMAGCTRCEGVLRQWERERRWQQQLLLCPECEERRRRRRRRRRQRRERDPPAEGQVESKSDTLTWWS